MSSLTNLYSSIMTISTTKKVAVAHRLRTFNGHGRTVRRRTTRRLVFRPSAVMVDHATEVRQVKTPYDPVSMWGNMFSTFSLDHQLQQKYSEEIEELKKNVRSTLMAATSTRLLMFIDNLERLGLAYHFETEIEDKLKQVYDSLEKEGEDNDLFTTALRFRLLRQHRYQVSCDVFEQYFEEGKRVKESHCSDVEGLLSLYEAAYVGIPNEKILDEAMTITTRQLTLMLPRLESTILKEKVEHGLKFPVQRTNTIFSLRYYVEIYENDESRDALVLRLAKLNFNFMQNIYRSELSEATAWWNEYNLASEVPYIRDRMVECYVSGVTYRFEPQYSQIRMMVTKYYILGSVLDDTYDTYATPQEIDLMTQAMESWNTQETEKLPEYLKLVLKAFMRFTEEFACEAEKQGKSYVVPYVIEQMKEVGRRYAEAQEWTRAQESPTFQEYLANGRVTVLHYVLFPIIATFTKAATEETIHWLLDDSSKLVTWSADINRLLDDLATHQRESKNGTVLTPMDFYMKEKGVSRQEAIIEVTKLLQETWKEINAEWVNCKTVPKEICNDLVEISRLSEIYYKSGEDCYTNPEKNLAPIMAAVLLNPYQV
uniref:Terpene synthase 2 n=1 Tax=Prunella vulgaris TaxID=39358 RepID=A0A3S8D7T7_PRUVU|nr:terpene synthase 2 [Prunella vulgaris]